MHNKKKNNSLLFGDLPKVDSLRKIKPDDRFPCFLCFDHPADKISCKECNGNGWIFGSHPMVQFAEDYIQKRIGTASNVNNQINNSSHNNSDFGEIVVKMSGSYDPRKKPQSNHFQIESTKTIPFIDEVRYSREEEAEEETIWQQYFCNECVHQRPIRGKRYHCLECEDFDLCQQCMGNGYHSQHKMQQVDAIKRPNNEALVNKIKDINLRKSVRNYK